MSSKNIAAAARSESTDAENDGAFLGLTPAQLARRLRELDWAFEDSGSGDQAHGIHPYPAKFVPDLPRQLIRLLSHRGELVVDPFSGSGTAGVEALTLSRDFYGIDANPVGNAVARVKTRTPSPADLRAMRDLEASLLALGPDDLAKATPSWLPSIPNVDKWYDDGVFRALGVIRDLVTGIQEGSARELAMVAFIQAAAKLSFQESETRYVSAPRRIEVIDTPRTVLSELRRIRRLSEGLVRSRSSEPEFVDGDARDPAAFALEDESVGLIVTSPPYPNTYDYHLYHRFRLFWLGEDPKMLRRVEIGSHLKNQAIKDPTGAYIADMRAVLENCLRVLESGRYAVVVVGDGLFKGEIFPTSKSLAALAREIGYDHVDTLDRPLPHLRRSVTKPGRRLAFEQLLVLRRPSGKRTAVACAPNYSLFPYERDLQLRELDAMGGSPRETPEGETMVVPVPQLDRAAFTHALQLPGAEPRPTFQCRLEEAHTPSSRRKNSTYAGHGIHRYKGKFYPQLAKSLINLSGLELGRSLVGDPFGGSGTVASEAVLNGFDAATFDCNPVAAAVARAKVALVGSEARQIAAGLDRIRAEVESAPPGGSKVWTQFDEAGLGELRSWFPDSVIAKLNWLLEAIRSSTSGDAVVVLEVLVSDLIREVSQQEPKDLRIRRRKTPLYDAPVYELFLSRLSTLGGRLEAFIRDVDPLRPDCGAATVVCGDSGDPCVFSVLDGRRIDAVVSSPPYAAALPYIDTDRLSLGAVFGYAGAARRTLEQTMIGSREISKRQQATLEDELAGEAAAALPDSTLTFLTRFAEAVRSDEAAGFRRRQTPAVLFRYFRAMGDVLTNVSANLKPGAPCWLVLGDSRSTIGGHTWTIPTIDEIAAIGEHVGLTLVDRIPITVTREDVVHARHAITRNEILHLRHQAHGAH